jgi:hypothetical protein
MGGTSQTSQTQQSTTNPWAPAQPALGGILGQVTNGLDHTALTGTESGALDTLTQNGQNATAQYAPQIGGYANDLLAGGGALNQAGNVNQNYLNYRNATQPLANNTNYDPYNTPGFSDAIRTMTNDITNNTNGQFAAAGRDFSGANSMALGRGIAQGVAPTIAAQYNANRDAQQGAAGNLYGAGNTNSGILAGLQQQKLANQGQGVTAAGQATSAQNAAPDAALQAEAARRGIPMQALGLLAQIGIPIAGLGGQSTGQSQGTQQMSGADQFLKIGQGAGGFGKLLFG